MMGIECRWSIRMMDWDDYNAKRDDMPNVGSDQNIYSDKLGYCDEEKTKKTRGNK